MALPATDNFNRGDTNPIGGNWSTQGSAWPYMILSSALRGTTADFHAAYWNADAFNVDHYSELVITTVNDGGPAVRMDTASGQKNYYWGDVKPTQCAIKKQVANADLQIGSAVSRTNNNGQTWRLKAEGVNPTTLTLYENGVQIVQVTDSDLDTGKPGAADYGGTTIMDNFQADNLSAATTLKTATFTDSLAGGELL